MLYCMNVLPRTFLLQGLTMLAKMLDETLAARNKLHKFIGKIAKEKKASQESNTQNMY